VVVDEDEPKERLQISLSQVAASSAAAVSAAVLCSFFGVAGTVIGTAVASVLATVGSALYVHSLRRTKARLRRLHQAGAASPPFSEVIKTARQQGRRMFGQVPWRYAVAGAVAAFVVAIAVVTVIELGVGEPLAALFGVSHSGGRTTTVGSFTHSGGHRHHHTKPTPSQSPSSPSTTKTSKPAPTETVTQTVTATPTSPTPPPSTTPPVSTTPSGAAS
jgi:hypothetical protein